MAWQYEKKNEAKEHNYTRAFENQLCFVSFWDYEWYFIIKLILTQKIKIGTNCGIPQIT